MKTLYDEEIEQLSSITREVLSIAVDLTLDSYPELRGNYKGIAEKITSELGEECTERDVWLYYEPTVAQDQEDVQILLGIVMC